MLRVRIEQLDDRRNKTFETLCQLCKGNRLRGRPSGKVFGDSLFQLGRCLWGCGCGGRNVEPELRWQR